ncbi:MAG: IPTL-CTERM sorting domain-containing protein, partial [Thermoanaerobaculales bacterium]|nr:IPTL-CTERM sorting domain-containing protein [Thermoanaerobaculales bacterium]
VASSLPPGSLVIYEANTGPADSVVTLIPEGAGWIVFFGWDWYNGAPTGSEDGGWLEVLDRGVNPGGLVAVDVPTLSQWGMITLVLLLATTGAFLVARRRLI